MKAGRIKMLAVTSRIRSALAPAIKAADVKN